MNPWKLTSTRLMDRAHLHPADRPLYPAPFTLDVRFEAGESPALVAASQRAGSAALADLRAVRDGLLATLEPVAALQRLQASKAEAGAALAQAERAAADALDRQREALAVGRDPGPAEQDYRQAVADRAIYQSRAAELGRLAQAAEQEARQALREAFDARRRELAEQAQAEADQAAPAVLAALGALATWMQCITRKEVYAGPRHAQDDPARLLAEL